MIFSGTAHVVILSLYKGTPVTQKRNLNADLLLMNYCTRILYMCGWFALSAATALAIL